MKACYLGKKRKNLAALGLPPKRFDPLPKTKHHRALLHRFFASTDGKKDQSHGEKQKKELPGTSKKIPPSTKAPGSISEKKYLQAQFLQETEVFLLKTKKRKTLKREKLSEKNSQKHRFQSLTQRNSTQDSADFQGQYRHNNRTNFLFQLDHGEDFTYLLKVDRS